MQKNTNNHTITMHTARTQPNTLRPLLSKAIPSASVAVIYMSCWLYCYIVYLIGFIGLRGLLTERTRAVFGNTKENHVI